MTKKLRRGLLAAGILICAVCLLTNPKAANQGALKGILLCGKSAIPSLFPMTFLTVMLCRIAGGGILPVWLLSLISGYPVGARLIQNRLESGAINEKQAQRGMLFCVNAGPAFIVTAVGYAWLGNIRLGWLLLLAHLLGSLVVFLLCKGHALEKTPVSDNTEPFLDTFTQSARESTNAMVQICGWIVLFSSFCAVLEQSVLPVWVKNTLLATLEITSAVTRYRAPVLLSFLLGFGGFCVHFQVLSASRQARPSYPIFFLVRLLHGLLSAIFCHILLKCFPIAVETAAVSLSSARENHTAAFCSLLFTMLVFAFSIKNDKKV